MKINYIFAERVNECLEKKGMTQEELSDITGIKETRIRKYVNGEWIPRSSEFLAIAKALGLSPNYLLYRDGFMTIECIACQHFNDDDSKNQCEDCIHNNKKSYWSPSDETRKKQDKDDYFDMIGQCSTCKFSKQTEHDHPCNICKNNFTSHYKPIIDKTEDMINHPAHYETGKYECIEVMKEVMGEAAVMDFCLCNAFKYLYRCRSKHESPDEDIKKAIWYLNKFLEVGE